MARFKIKLTDYSRPGKGVKKDEPNKRRFIVFFEVLTRKFWNLALLNIVFAMFPAVAVLLVFMLLYFGIGHPLVLLLPVIPLSIGMPGLFYIVRNFVRQEPVFLREEFFGKIRENWKNALIHGVFLYILCAIFSFVIPFYSLGDGLMTIPFVLSIVALLIFIFAQYYIYTMMVTFDLKYRSLLKNALIFAVSSLMRNLGVTVILAVIWGGLVYLFLTVGGIFGGLLFLFMMAVGFSLSAYIVVFITYPVIEKQLIVPFYSEDKQQEEPEDTADEPDTAPDKPRGDYVFRNGRLIKLSDISDEKSVFEDKG